MDHLLSPGPVSRAQSSLFEIRCFAKDDYDDGEFSSFPERQGWMARSNDAWLVLIQDASEEFQSLLQRWLYFGVLHLFFRKRVSVKEMSKISKDGSHMCLDSTALLRLISAWLDDLKGFQKSDYMGLIAGLSEARFVHEVLRTSSQSNHFLDPNGSSKLLEFLHGWSAGGDPREPMMIEAQAALFDALDGALAMAREAEIGPEANLPSSLSAPSGGSSHQGGALWNLMQSQGWCCSELTMVFGSFSVAGIFYLSHIERPNSAYKHRPNQLQGTDGTGHQQQQLSTCTSHHCGLYQLNQSAYKTRHVEACIGCYEIHVEADLLYAILRRGRIPLVRMLKEGDLRKTVELVEYDGFMPYVAFSHVWADGLGNLEQNAIPSCQMLRLSDQVKSLPDDHFGPSQTTLFWLDTLCCPPDSAGHQQEQNIALKLMRQTYMDAHAVIVLDSWLCRQALNKFELIDPLFRVICSPWTRRLWTLQEGALAKRLLIKSVDGFFDPDKAIEMLMLSGGSSTGLMNIRTDILHRWYNIRGFRHFKGSDLFYSLYPSLAFRTTSVLEDEALCLGTLFGLDVAVIAEAKTHEERMLRFWSMFSHLPAEILDHYEQRLTVPGYRWAPRSFIGDDKTGFPLSNRLRRHGDWPQAKRVESAGGLQLTARGYRVHVQDMPLGSRIFIRDNTGLWSECALTYDVPEEIDAYKINGLETTSENGEPLMAAGIHPSKAHGAKAIALIYQNWGHMHTWHQERGDALRLTGTVGSITSVDDGQITVRRCGIFVSRPVPSTDSTIIALEEAITKALIKGLAPKDMILIDRTTGRVLAGFLEELPSDQLWLID